MRVLRGIARLNLGGPAHNATILSARLDPDRYTTMLVTGTVGPGEAVFREEPPGEGVPTYPTYQIPSLSPIVSPPDDLRALREMVKVVRRFRPHIIHTHTAKAGMIGRLAALVTDPRPLLVHTFHGHVLTGYFGPGATFIYREAERLLARRTDCLIGVSHATVHELVELGIAPPSRFRTVPVGLDLDPFLALRHPNLHLRGQLAIGRNGVMALYVGRLAPIKRLDVALRAVMKARSHGAPITLVIAGDGSEHGALKNLAVQYGIGEHVKFLGYRRDVVALLAAADLALLTSDNEGTPVFLIEAAAAARPAVATAVGGVPEVVTDASGVLVPARATSALAAALVRLSADAGARARMGLAGRTFVAQRFGSERLVNDIDALYGELLARRGRVSTVPGAG